MNFSSHTSNTNENITNNEKDKDKIKSFQNYFSNTLHSRINSTYMNSSRMRDMDVENIDQYLCIMYLKDNSKGFLFENTT